MAAHQNAAKRLKALLRRVHFPVQRFKQLHDNSGSSNVSGGGGSGGGSSGSVNSWDGIVGGDPRAALVVLHWTLLDMSPLFVTWLLDRNHSGLQSLPDHKFVWTCLKMLRDEFGFRPQLTVEQFLSCGYAEVKLCLLAEVVELVMRTHHSLADKDRGGNTGDANTDENGNGGYREVAALRRGSTGGGARSTRSSGGVGGRSSDGDVSPWNKIPVAPHLPRSGSLDGRGDTMIGGSASVHVVPPHSPSHQLRLHPPLLYDGPCLVGSGRVGCGSGGLGIGTGCHARYPTPSPTGFSDDQNPPPPVRLSRNAPCSCPGPTLAHPSPAYAGVPRASWNIGDTRSALYHHHHHHRGPGTGDWARGPGYRGEDSLATRLPGTLPSRSGVPTETPSGRSSPLGPPSAQPALNQQHQQYQEPVMEGGSAISPAGQQSDWAAVQKAFGSPSALHLPLPPPMMMPTSPHSGSPVPNLTLLPSSLSCSVAAATAATSITVGAGGGAENVSKLEGFAYANNSGGDTGTEGTAVGSDISVEGEGDSEHSSSGSRSAFGGPDGGGEDAALSSFSAAMGKIQMQIQPMLERQSRVFDERMRGIEQMLSARLTLLEGKVQGLEHRPTPTGT